MNEKRILERKKIARSEKDKPELISACEDHAELYSKQGHYQLAIKEYEAIAKIHHSDGKAIECAKVHRKIGEAYLGMHNFVKALEHQMIYLDTAVKENNVVEQQRAYGNIGHVYLTHYLETQMDLDKNLNAAYKYFMKSLTIAESLTDINIVDRADMLARLCSNLGLVKDSMGDYGKASELLSRSIEICKQHDIYEQLCRCYTSMASLYRKKGDSNETIHYYNLTIDAAKKLKGNVDIMCGALLDKSEVLIKLSYFYSAKQTLLEAHKLKTMNLEDRKNIERSLKSVATICHIEDNLVNSCKDDKEKKKMYEKMGDCACALKNYAKAIEYYKLMLKFAEKCGTNGRELASCYYSLAETYKDNHQFSEAEEYFEREYSLCENLEDKLNTLSEIADTKEAAGAPVSDVKTVYEKALDSCRNNGNVKEERWMCLRFISYLRRVGNQSDASELEKYIEKHLSPLDEPDNNDESADNENNLSGSKCGIEYDLDLDEIIDSKFESTDVSKRKHRKFVVQKNVKGESQLTCINEKIPVVRSPTQPAINKISFPRDSSKDASEGKKRSSCKRRAPGSTAGKSGKETKRPKTADPDQWRADYSEVATEDKAMQLIICRENQPEVGFSEDQLLEFVDAVGDAIAETQGTASPQFKSSKLCGKQLLVTAANEFSKEWLTREIKNIKPWENVTLVITDPTKLKLHRAMLWIPGKRHISNQDVLVRLEKQNPGLSTSSWRIWERNDEKQGLRLILGLEEESIKLASGMNFQLYYNASQVTITVLRGPMAQQRISSGTEAGTSGSHSKSAKAPTRGNPEGSEEDSSKKEIKGSEGAPKAQVSRETAQGIPETTADGNPTDSSNPSPTSEAGLLREEMAEAPEEGPQANPPTTK